MLNTSTEYKNAIFATARTNLFSAEFSFVPDGAAENAELLASAENDNSNLQEINDGNTYDVNWSSFEHNRWILDGTAKTPTQDGAFGFGFWSANQSGNDKTFTVPPYVEFDFDAEYDLVGITIDFDAAGNEWAKDITINYYDNNNNVINSASAQPDTPHTVVHLTQQGVKKVRIIINSWCLPFRFAKIQNVILGEIFVFDGNNIFSFKLSENLNLFANSFDASEFVIEYDNSGREFDLLNPAGIFAYLRQKMKMRAKVGTLLGNGVPEWVDAGAFYLYEIPTNQSADVFQFICRPEISVVDYIKYPTDHKAQTTVADVVATIWQVGNLKPEYEIAEELQNITVNGYCGDDVPLSSAFAQIATAAGGYWKISRDGSLYQLLSIENLINDNTSVVDIDYDNVFDKPNITFNRVTAVECSGNYFKTLSVFDNIYEDWSVATYTAAAEINDGNTVQISSAFICNIPQAQAVAELALRFYQKAYTYSVNWRGDVANEVGDIANIQTDYGFLNGVLLDLNFTLDGGGLTASVTGRGEPVD